MIAGFAAGTSSHGHRETRATGLANVDTGEPMTAQSVLHVASLSKPMVAAAFVAAAPQLVDTPIIELLPELAQTWRVWPGLTARDLLSHSSGVTPVCSSVTDVLAFAEFLLGSPALLAEVTGPVIANPVGTWYGLGWHLDRPDPQLAWHHGISHSGYRAGLAIAVRQGFAAVALANDTEAMPVVDDWLTAKVAGATGLRLQAFT